MRVLLVEDETSVATGVKRALVADGYAVDVAADGALGLELAGRSTYDVIILDVMVPKVNGFEVCRTLRAAGSRVPIVMLTAKSGQWDIVEGLDLGADDYLTKPFSLAVLLARVRARTRPAGSAAGVLVHGDLRLDPGVRRCWRGDEEIELTGRETRLLTELFRADGVPSTKDELLQRVWGGGFRGDPNVVEVYVARLRRKLGAASGSDDIETIRGVGYRLRTRDATSPER